MADRTYAEVLIRTTDYHKHRELIDDELAAAAYTEDHSAPHITRLEICEIIPQDLAPLIDIGIPFVGYHQGYNGSYPASVMACDGDRFDQRDGDNAGNLSLPGLIAPGHPDAIPPAYLEFARFHRHCRRMLDDAELPSAPSRRGTAWTQLLDAAEDRHQRAVHLEPEEYDDESHEATCRESFENAADVLATARCLPDPYAEIERLTSELTHFREEFEEIRKCVGDDGRVDWLARVAIDRINGLPAPPYPLPAAVEAKRLRSFITTIARMKKEGEFYDDDGRLIEDEAEAERLGLQGWEPDGSDDEIDALYSLISKARNLTA